MTPFPREPRFRWRGLAAAGRISAAAILRIRFCSFLSAAISLRVQRWQKTQSSPLRQESAWHRRQSGHEMQHHKEASTLHGLHMQSGTRQPDAP